ncbi:GNAT family N-acetyltransferase [Actinopolymorpha sp. NPDC004070]|uniref:GNAT family N-acetyltransferase n=1 Tax=Actinopolymorpha sp. NPDC004070 TaxID=3154548 RepID=UPI0033B40F93
MREDNDVQEQTKPGSGGEAYDAAPVTISPVDIGDDAAMARWHKVFHTGLMAGLLDPPAWTLPEVLVLYRSPDSSMRREAFVAVDGSGEVVGAGELQLPLRENPRLAIFEIGVPPEHRRRGVGGALYAHVAERARAEGRSSLMTEVNVPDGAPQEEWPGVAFAHRVGFTLRNTELRRQLRLPVEPVHLRTLAGKAAQRASDYRLVSWSGPCPAEYAEQYAELKGRLSVDAPMGDMDYEQEVWDVARLRESEDRAAAQGRALHTTVAVAPDGTLAGHTQLAVPRHEPGRAYQWDTLVLAAHRGHRLGLALKVANTRALAEAHPEVARIDTWNAVQNGPMVAVNVELGYRIMDYCQEWQRDL